MHDGFRFCRIGSAAVLAALLLLAPNAAFATDVGPEGDGNTYGGSPYRLQCYGNGNNQSYLYGMSGMIGSWVDRVGGECADWVPGQGWSSAWNARSKTGTTGNSTGGGQQSAICPAGTLVKGFHYTWAVPDRTYMQNITLICVDPQPPFTEHPEARELKSDNGELKTNNCTNGFCEVITDPGSWPTVTCPGNEVATGLQGGSGTFVDWIGLICGPPPTPAAASSASSSSDFGIARSKFSRSVAGDAIGGGGSASVCGDPQIGGEWKTSEGTMTFTQNGKRLDGTYPAGQVSGGVVNGTFNGVWTQQTSGKRCPRPQHQGTFYWGQAQFIFNSQNCHFDGSYSYCNDPGGANWTGDRVK